MSQLPNNNSNSSNSSSSSNREDSDDEIPINLFLRRNQNLLPSLTQNHTDNEERKEDYNSNFSSIFSNIDMFINSNLRSRTPHLNRCHHVNDDFTFCNRRRMATQTVCLQHYNERMTQRRNLYGNNENQNAPMPVDETENNNMNVPIIEENEQNEEVQNEEVQSSNISELESLLSIRPLRLPPRINVTELPNLPPLEEVPEVPPPLVRQDAVVFEDNNPLQELLEDIIPIARRVPPNLDDIIRRRAISSRYRRRASQPILVEENSEHNYCLLCENFVVKPWVELKCKHKYHLNCFVIDNTTDEHTLQIKECCNKCNKKIIYEQEEYDCSICLEKIIDHKILSNLPCDHKFHLHCIEQWRVMNKNTCPLCRTEF